MDAAGDAIIGLLFKGDILRGDCVHEQVAKRIANVRFTGILYMDINGNGGVSRNYVN